MHSVECCLRAFFGSIGIWTASRPFSIALGTTLGLLTLGLGLLTLQVENDVANMWISQRGRINSERAFYEANFELKSPQVSAFIIEGKPGYENVLHEAALEEVQDLQKWIREYKYWPGGTAVHPVSLENMCYKTLNREPEEPCFQYSVLDCFQEGQVFNVGGEFNSKYNAIYSVRNSYKGFNVSEDFTMEYIRQHCVQWTNAGTASSMILGGVTEGVNSKNENTVIGVKALRIVFGTKAPETLVEEGLTYIKYKPGGVVQEEGGTYCPDVDKCVECVEGLDLDTAARAGCIPAPVQQPDSCCELMEALRTSPCIETLFQVKPDVRALGNMVLGACSLPTVELENRCSNTGYAAGDDLPGAIDDAETAGGYPSICICLEGMESADCSAAVSQFINREPQWKDTFKNAQDGEQDSIEEIRAFLTDDLACKGETAEELPDVCTCLVDTDDPKCQSGVVEVLSDRPDLGESFAAAASGSTQAQAYLAGILLQDYGCSFGNRKLLKQRNANRETYSDEDSNEDLCSCLSNPSDDKCLRGGEAFIVSNPKYAEAFTAAANGDQSAISKIAGVLLNICSNQRDAREVKKKLNFVPETNSNGHEKTLSSELQDNLKQAEDVGNAAKETEVSLSSQGSFSAEPFTSRNEVETDSQARSVLHSWEKAWQKDINKKVQSYKFIDVKWAASSSLDDTAREAGKAQAPLLGIGYILVLAYVMLFFTFDRSGSKIHIKTTPPGPCIAMLGFFSILSGMIATFGIIGFLSLTPIKASSITVQIVPLLMVGLGINDFFVLARSVKSVVESMSKGSCIEIMEAAMASGGTSVTLSSASNAAAFALGALSPIPAVQWFSIHMMIGVIVAYFVSMTVIPCLLAWATQRWVNGQSDPFLSLCTNAQKGMVTYAEREEEEAAPDTPMSNAMHQRLADKPPAHAARKPPCTAAFMMSIIGVYLGLLGISIWGITCLDQGLNPSQAVPKDGQLYKYLKPSEKYFQSYPIYIVFRDGQNFSDSSVFEAARKAEFQFVVDGYKVDTSSKVTSWMEYYIQYVEGKMCANEICMNEVEWVWDGFSAEEFGDKDICKGLQDPAECGEACMDHCPQGPSGSSFRCQLSPDKKSCYCPWRPIMKPHLFYQNPKGYDSKIPSFWADFLVNTTGGAVARSLVALDPLTVTPENPFGEALASRSLAFVKDVPDVEQKLQHLKRGRKILDKSSVKVFPFDYTVYAVGEQYDHLPERTCIAVGISVAIAAIIMIPLISQLLTVLIVTICILSAVTISAGLSPFLGLSLNYALYVSLVVAVGLSVEFCVHIAREFMMTAGNRATRSREALKNMGVAAFNGGITTFLGLLPVAWTQFPYFQVYFFRQYSLIVGVGLFIGLGLLPVLLSLFGPATHHCVQQRDRKYFQQSYQMTATGNPQSSDNPSETSNLTSS